MFVSAMCSWQHELRKKSCLVKKIIMMTSSSMLQRWVETILKPMHGNPNDPWLEFSTLFWRTSLERSKNFRTFTGSRNKSQQSCSVNNTHPQIFPKFPPAHVMKHMSIYTFINQDVVVSFLKISITLRNMGLKTRGLEIPKPCEKQIQTLYRRVQWFLGQLFFRRFSGNRRAAGRSADRLALGEFQRRRAQWGSMVRGSDNEWEATDVGAMGAPQKHMGVSKNRGGPPKWMVYNGKPY